MLIRLWKKVDNEDMPQIISIKILSSIKLRYCLYCREGLPIKVIIDIVHRIKDPLKYIVVCNSEAYSKSY